MWMPGGRRKSHVVVVCRRFDRRPVLTSAAQFDDRSSSEQLSTGRQVGLARVETGSDDGDDAIFRCPLAKHRQCARPGDLLDGPDDDVHREPVHVTIGLLGPPPPPNWSLPPSRCRGAGRRHPAGEASPGGRLRRRVPQRGRDFCHWHHATDIAVAEAALDRIATTHAIDSNAIEPDRWMGAAKRLPKAGLGEPFGPTGRP